MIPHLARTELVVGAGLLAPMAAVVAAGFRGARWLLCPPKMSAMTVFPDQFGVTYEKVSFRAKDGHRLSGWFVPSPTGENKTLLVCHGWGDNKGEVLERTLFLNRKEGFNLLYFDFRGHGESDASLVTMGKLELRDFAGAVAWLEAEKPRCAERLGVYGLSMGASVAAMALSLHPRLRAAVLESPFADYHEVGARWAWNYARVPYYPTIPVLTLWARLLSGHWDLDRYNPQERIGEAAPIPALFIAGQRDTLMLPRDVARVCLRARGDKRLWIVPDAPHAKCRETAPEEYDARVGRFLAAYFGVGSPSHACAAAPRS